MLPGQEMCRTRATTYMAGLCCGSLLRWSFTFGCLLVALLLVYYASVTLNIRGRGEENARTNPSVTSKKYTHQNRNLIKNFREESTMPPAFQARQSRLHTKLCFTLRLLD